MEAAMASLFSKVVTLMALFVASYGVIIFSVHKGLRSAMPDKAVRQGLVKVLSVIAFGVITSFVLHMTGSP